jgi:hypothetical protein
LDLALIVAATSAAAVPSLRLASVGSLGVEASHEAAEKWDGEVRHDGNLGRTELLLAATLSYSLSVTELGLSARVPVWRHIVIGDEPPGNAELANHPQSERHSCLWEQAVRRHHHSRL